MLSLCCSAKFDCVLYRCLSLFVFLLSMSISIKLELVAGPKNIGQLTFTTSLSNMAASSSTATQPSIPVVFSTKTMYQLPSQRFMVPASWQRFQLSQLINTALSLPRVVPFDFLIGGTLLRGTLSEAAHSEVSRQIYFFGQNEVTNNWGTGGNARD